MEDRGQLTKVPDRYGLIYAQCVRVSAIVYQEDHRVEWGEKVHMNCNLVDLEINGEREGSHGLHSSRFGG